VKIHPAGAELLHVGGRTGRYDEDSSRFFSILRRCQKIGQNLFLMIYWFFQFWNLSQNVQHTKFDHNYYLEKTETDDFVEVVSVGLRKSVEIGATDKKSCAQLA
jgi:hypothetical protein